MTSDKQTVRAGFMYFSPGSRESATMVGFAVFNNGMCTSVIYNQPLLERLVEDTYHGLYVVPEYLSHAIAGIQESFWTNFLVKSDTFVSFTAPEEFTRAEFSDKLQPMLPYMKLLQEQNNIQ